MNDTLPLGRVVDYPRTYAPDVLQGIPRKDARATLGLAAPLPFVGQDLWNAWELTWLQDSGHPDIAALEFAVPADSPNIVESKSLKLYLNSYAMSRFASRAEVEARITDDLSKVLLAPISARLFSESENAADVIPPAGVCIDSAPADFGDLEQTTKKLRVAAGEVVEEVVYSDLFRSLCPVTAQPDYATLTVAYHGERIDHGSLLAYLVAFREHQDFHEACIERIFADLLRHCRPKSLCVSARFLRRGGIDINPWRASSDIEIANRRHWRQ